MEELLLFIMSYVLIFVIYQLFIVIPAKKRNNKKKSNKELLEIKYLEVKYNLDLKRINYNQLVQICGIVSSLDISIAVYLVTLVKSLFLEILVGFISVFFLIFISYYLVYLFYKRKGMIKNGKN